MDAHAAPAGTSRLVPPVPEPPEHDLSMLRFIAAIRTNGTAGWSKRAYEELVSRRSLLGRSNLMVNDPDGIRHVLVDNVPNYRRTPASVRVLRPMLGDGLLISEGQAWRRQRRVLAPAFTPRAVEVLVPHILSATNEAIARVAAAAEAGPVDLFDALQHLALEIAGRTMFSVDMRRHGERLRQMIAAYQTRLGRPHLPDLLLPLRWPAPHDIPRALFRRRWVRFLDEVIAAREAKGDTATSGDLLDLLVAARDSETGEGFTREQLRDQVATMIMAGHETTAVTLLWAAYLLALSPEWQDAVAEEAQEAGADLEMGWEDRLPLTRAVIDETLRLYPPAHIIVRMAQGPDVVAGQAIAAGDVVAISPWILHRHRRLWLDPAAFDPRRFLPGAPAIPRMAYLPFGVGPRICIGAQFALAEATLALAKLAGAFRMTIEGTRPVLPAAVVTTQPDHAPGFRLSRR